MLEYFKHWQFAHKTKMNGLAKAFQNLTFIKVLKAM